MLTSEREVCVAKSKPKGKSDQSIETANRRKHRYLNSAFPTLDHMPARPDGGNLVCHPIDMLCERCGYGYSHLARGAKQPCNECAIEIMAALAAELQDAGIELGWSRAGDTLNDDMRFTRRFDVRKAQHHK